MLLAVQPLTGSSAKPSPARYRASNVVHVNAMPHFFNKYFQLHVHVYVMQTTIANGGRML